MKAQIAHTPESQPRAKILVIEDEPALSLVLTRVLKNAGFDVAVAATGTGGLRLADEQKCDLILSDIDLPDIRGFEVCERVKQNPQLRLIPVILMSGRLAEGNEARALKVGAADYLSKPFGAETVVKKISAHIRGGKNGKGTT
jgi:two-component system OmpR family response regulator